MITDEEARELTEKFSDILDKLRKYCRGKSECNSCPADLKVCKIVKRKYDD